MFLVISHSNGVDTTAPTAIRLATESPEKAIEVARAAWKKSDADLLSMVSIQQIEPDREYALRENLTPEDAQRHGCQGNVVYLARPAAEGIHETAAIDGPICQFVAAA
jgi:hypothetical protein